MASAGYMEVDPRVVVIGGGRGLAVTVRAVRSYAGYTTAVVTTADDSGSTGRLRRSVALPALGDLRRCLVAMAGADEKPLNIAFEHRFPGTDVAGHTLGNLLLAGLTAITGTLGEALGEAGQLLGANPDTGQTLPSTVDPVDLCATTVAGAEVFGQYAVSQTPGIERVALRPSQVHAPDSAVKAILDADQIVLGPGSLYTSILAAALVPDIQAALAQTAATRVYVCNLEPENAETLGYDVAAHVAALRAHGIEFDVVLVNQGGAVPLGGLSDAGDLNVRVVEAELAVPDATTHDIDRLAGALTGLLP